MVWFCWMLAGTSLFHHVAPAEVLLPRRDSRGSFASIFLSRLHDVFLTLIAVWVQNELCEACEYFMKMFGGKKKHTYAIVVVMRYLSEGFLCCFFFKKSSCSRHLFSSPAIHPYHLFTVHYLNLHLLLFHEKEQQEHRKKGKSKKLPSEVKSLFFLSGVADMPVSTSARTTQMLK